MTTTQLIEEINNRLYENNQILDLEYTGEKITTFNANRAYIAKALNVPMYASIQDIMNDLATQWGIDPSQLTIYISTNLQLQSKMHNDNQMRYFIEQAENNKLQAHILIAHEKEKSNPYRFGKFTTFTCPVSVNVYNPDGKSMLENMYISRKQVSPTSESEEDTENLSSLNFKNPNSLFVSFKLKDLLTVDNNSAQIKDETSQSIINAIEIFNEKEYSQIR